MGYDMYIISGMTDEEQQAETAAREAWNEAIAKRDAIEWTPNGDIDIEELKRRTEAGEDWNIVRLTLQGAPENFLEAQRLVDEAYDALDKARSDYFRLNIWGMGRYRQIMYLMGMGVDSEPGPWPEPEVFGVTSEQAWDEEVPADEETSTKVQAFQDAVSEYKRASFTEVEGIPLHKFGSNDGWLVTEEECAEALVAFANFTQVTWQDYVALSADDRRNLIVERLGITDGVQEAIDSAVEDYFGEWLGFLDRASTRGGFEVY